jgi:hypothetical protein
MGVGNVFHFMRLLPQRFSSFDLKRWIASFSLEERSPCMMVPPRARCGDFSCVHIINDLMSRSSIAAEILDVKVLFGYNSREGYIPWMQISNTRNYRAGQATHQVLTKGLLSPSPS